MKNKRKGNSLKNQQKQKLSLQLRLLIGTTCILLVALGIFVAIQLSSIEKSLAGSSGNYRAVKSGLWEDADVWEVFDGKSWTAATQAPLNIGNSIAVTVGVSLKAQSDISCAGLTIEKGGSLQLLAGQLTISKENAIPSTNIYGTLDAGSCILNGNGKFYLADAATLIIGSEQGISKGGNTGNIQLSGSRYYSSFANYIYNATVLQQSGSGLPYTVAIFQVDNIAGVKLENDLNITSLLKINRGNLYTGIHRITLGNDIMQGGTLERVSGGIQGNFTRWVDATTMKNVEFPMLLKDNCNTLFMTVNPEYFKGGTFAFTFVESKPDKHLNSSQDSRIMAIGETGYYSMEAGNGLENGTYKFQSAIALSKSETKNYWLVTGRKPEERKGNETLHGSTVFLQDVVVSPNPFRDLWNLDYNLEAAAEVSMDMLNANGQLVFSEKMMGKEGSNRYEFRNKHNLVPGNYYLTIKSNGVNITRKLVKQ